LKLLALRGVTVKIKSMFTVNPNQRTWGDLWAKKISRVSLAETHQNHTQAICEPLWAIESTKINCQSE